MGINVYPVPSSALREYTQVFKTSGTWTCPSGVSNVGVMLVGGGGGGGSAVSGNISTNNAAVGGGGGAGQLVTSSVSVTPGVTYTVEVGAGGSGSTVSTSSGSNGGNTSFGLTATYANAFPYSTESAKDVQTYNSGSGATSLNTFFGGWFYSYSNGVYLPSTAAYNVNSSGYTAFSSLSFGIQTSTAPSGHSGYIFRTTPNNGYGALQNWVSVVAGTQYTASGSFWTESSGIQVSVRIDWYSAFQGTLVSSSVQTPVAATASTWAQYSVTGTAPAGATFGLVRYGVSANGFNPSNTGWLNLQFEQGASVTSFKGPFSGNGGTWTQTGIYNVSAGEIASGGGGGGSSNLPSSTYTIAGIGGGGSSFSSSFVGTFSSSSAPAIGGGGLSQFGRVEPPSSPFTTSTSPTYSKDGIATARSPYAGNGSNAYRVSINTGSPLIITNSGAPGNTDGYCAGGNGGVASNAFIVSRFNPGSGTAGLVESASDISYTGNAELNTGSGGGGAAIANKDSSLTAIGSSGGSGIAILRYWGN